MPLPYKVFFNTKHFKQEDLKERPVLDAMDAIQWAKEIAHETGETCKITNNAKILLATVTRKGDITFHKIGGIFHKDYERRLKAQKEWAEEQDNAE